jgi:hypothetical protein
LSELTGQFAVELARRLKAALPADDFNVEKACTEMFRRVRIDEAAFMFKGVAKEALLQLLVLSAQENAISIPGSEPRSAALTTLHAGDRGWPRAWKLLGHLLTRKGREEVFLPSYHDLVHDYLLARQESQSRWWQRSLTAIYTMKAVALYFRSLWTILGDRTKRLLVWVILRIFRW